MPTSPTTPRRAAGTGRGAPLTAGVGARRGVSGAEVLALVRDVLAEAGAAEEELGALATVDAKRDEPGIVAAARALGVPLLTYGAAELARVEVPNPSGAALTAVGTPSVAEAAALARGGRLLVPKRTSRPQHGPPGATCALSRTPEHQPSEHRPSEHHASELRDDEAAIPKSTASEARNHPLEAPACKPHDTAQEPRPHLAGTRAEHRAPGHPAPERRTERGRGANGCVPEVRPRAPRPHTPPAPSPRKPGPRISPPTPRTRTAPSPEEFV
ncbi:cobalamin biosynthesis protein [Streptomyces sp. Da 82-17]|uniref:cobalamin biosynthesis protein n=1 Tax=Streptomyces sp. Da 82-17 TaxID=3377116 RepID=UPI0038D3E8C9